MYLIMNRVKRIECEFVFSLIDDEDRCEKAVKFTKCIYSHRNEVSTATTGRKWAVL